MLDTMLTWTTFVNSELFSCKFKANIEVGDSQKDLAIYAVKIDLE